MASFLTSLWESVFTPGPTPTLLLATNITFACLQALLFALFIATYSIHFAVLSFLCAGLWYSINWFAIELAAAREKEAEAEKLRKMGKRREGDGEVADDEDEGEQTEVEDLKGEERVRREVQEAMGLDGQGSGERGSGKGTTTAVEKQAEAGAAEARQRRVEELDRSGDVSTDSEWERVSQDGAQ